MLSTAVVNLITFFYPVGNTPAVSLTEGIPLKTPADILLLGCGDLRHILFTIHIDSRNIILLSLLVDDADGISYKASWDIYFHFKISEPCLERLQAQAGKLYSQSETLQDWQNSEYGKFIKFCDTDSMVKVRGLWKFYRSIMDDAELANLESRLRTAKGFRGTERENLNITSLRSASPVFIDAVQDLPDLHNHYWEHGSTDTDPKVLASAKHLNPMFVLAHPDYVLHYGTDPLLGFHLATAYVPLAENSKAGVQSSPTSLRGQRSRQYVVDTARAEFSIWAESFRQYVSTGTALSMRVFVGDALAFCGSLSQMQPRCGNRRTDESRNLTPYSYRDRYNFEPLKLDGNGDITERSLAPVRFDVIDTSNLMDHVGSVNILTATAPLLKVNNSATLYTEKLLKLEETRKEMVDGVLCGDILTVSMLLDLIPMDMVTNTSTTSSGDEAVVSTVFGISGGPKGGIKQQFSRLAWKKPVRTSDAFIPQEWKGNKEQISFEPSELAKVLYSVYLKMFSAEDMTTIFNRTATHAHKYSLSAYHRGSFAALLKVVKQRVSTDWGVVMNCLLALVESNTSHILSRNYIQELYLWLHILHVHSVDILRVSPPLPTHVIDCGITENLRQWTNIPSTVCVTLEIARKYLTVFTGEDPSTLGTPPIQCSLPSPQSTTNSWENSFAAVQSGFGHLSVSGSRFSDSFQVRISNDDSGWLGSSPLLVSFYIPAWILLLEPCKAVLSLCLQSTPQSIQIFLGRLGLNLSVFETTLEDASHVFITRYPPNLATTPLIVDCAVGDQDQDDVPLDIRRSLTTSVDTKATRVVSLVSRIDLLKEEHKEKLKTGCQVWSTSLPSLFQYKVSLTKEGPDFVLNFPFPVVQSSVKTRIARKSSYIELVAAVDTDKTVLWSAMHPSIRTGGSSGIVLWNIPYLYLDKQPMLDTTQHHRLSWLTTHVSMMFSARQRFLRDNPFAPAGPAERTRVELKDSLFSLIMHYTGLQGQQASVFGINCREQGGVNILLFVSGIRLDLSNRTLVLDSAVLPLYDALMPRITSFLQHLTESGRLCQILASEAELRLWKLLLPLWVERCRVWSHEKNCEFVPSGEESPLSMEKGKKLLCSCGEGILASGCGAGIPKWKSIAKYVVRAAISPSFPSILAEDMYTGAEQDRCNHCRKDEFASGVGLLQCARCRKASYCCRECQRADWKTHKAVCKEA
ncbi:hypothetical protein SCUP234_12650 [Seiridium cupressi]